MGYKYSGCNNLTSITIGNGVKSIGLGAFEYCSRLMDVNITDLTAWCNIISSYPWFSRVYQLYLNGQEIKDLIIPNNIASINRNAFALCGNLTSVTIPESVTNIGDRAFYGCSSLASITIPISVTSIENDAFSGCYFTNDKIINKSALTNENNWGATICDEETTDGLLLLNNVAVKCRTWATSITIPETVSSIGASAFSGCSNLTSITIGSGVKSIGNNAFEYCNRLTDVNITDLTAWCNIFFDNFDKNGSNPLSFGNFYLNGQEITNLVVPYSVTSISDYAFYNCNGLTSVTIPESVKNIGRYAFCGCKLRNVLIKCTTPPILDEEIYYCAETFSLATCQHATLYVPAGCWDAYAFADGWFWFNNIRETAITEEEVSEQQAYTLMDANTFTYSVYAPVNDCIGTINSASGINEDNPNHSWQMIEADGMHYLYNIGARKYVRRYGSSLALIDVPVPIDVEDGDNGLIFGAQANKQWALVSNERMNVAQAAIDEVTGIASPISSPKGKDYYDLSGRRIDKPQKGIYIKDGKKVLVK